MTDDINVNLDTRSGKLRAALTSKAAGTALLAATYFIGVAMVSSVIVAALAIVYRYDVEYSLKELWFRLKAPVAVTAEPKNSKSKVTPDITEKAPVVKDAPKPPTESNNLANNAPPVEN